MSMRLCGSLGLVLAFVAACGGDDTEDPSQGTTSGTASGSTSSDPTTGSASTTAEASSSSSSTGEETSGTTGAADSSSSTGDTDGSSDSSTTAAAGPTWENFGATFFESYCLECHGAGDEQGRDYSTLAGVMTELAPIRCGTGPASDPPTGCEGEPPAEQFPIGDTLPTEAERIMLVEWIDAGAPEN